jgi:DNA-binding transcriptional LysR family regulator
MTLRDANIELRHLRYFLAVAEELHYGRAAKRLHMAQPPLSHSIRRLESELGVRLLDRTSRSVSLTAAGRVFAEEARDILSGVEFAIHEARSAAAAEDATIRIGCVPDAPIGHLHRFLTGLRAIAGAQTVVEHAASHDQLEKLNSGEIDLAIVHDTAATAEIMTAPVFAGQPLVALLPAAHRAAALPAVSPTDLAGEPLLAFPGDASATLHAWIRRVAASAGYRLSKVIEGGGDDPRNAALAVADGLGIALVPATGPPVAELIVARRPLRPAIVMPDSVIAWRRLPPRVLRDALEPVRELAVDLHRTTIESGQKESR